jgi:hypothetical protein
MVSLLMYIQSNARNMNDIKFDDNNLGRITTSIQIRDNNFLCIARVSASCKSSTVHKAPLHSLPIHTTLL